MRCHWWCRRSCTRLCPLVERLLHPVDHQCGQKQHYDQGKKDFEPEVLRRVEVDSPPVRVQRVHSPLHTNSRTLAGWTDGHTVAYLLVQRSPLKPAAPVSACFVQYGCCIERELDSPRVIVK